MIVVKVGGGFFDFLEFLDRKGLLTPDGGGAHESYSPNDKEQHLKY